MAVFHFDNIKISGIAATVPKNIVNVSDFKRVFGEEEVNKFIQMTGINQIRRTTTHQTASDLGYTAAVNLLNHKNIKPGEIGAVVFGTHSPDFRRPASAFLLQKRLGIPIEAVVFDISLGCSSLVYGINVTASLLANSNISKALLIVGDTASKTTNPKDRASIMLVGEAGVAVLIEKKEGNEKMVSLLRSDGNGYRYLIVPGGGYRNLHASTEPFICQDGNERTMHNSFMQGTSVFTFTISDVPRLLKDYWSLTNTTIDDYDCVAFHQANLYILKQIAKKLKIPEEKMPLTLQKYGNTSGASPAVTLCDFYGNKNTGVINTLFCAFGVGLSWGVVNAKLDVSDILPITEDDSVFDEAVINTPADL